MKRAFARTANVNNFLVAMEKLQKRDEGVPGMALIYGEPGLGKSRTAIWWCLKNDGAFVRSKKLMTGYWLLEEVVSELGEAPMRRTSDLFRQVVDQLLSRPRPLMIDEADYLCYDSRVIETLRDIHDITNAPVIFIGMDMADKKLRRYRHLYDRFSEIVKFADLTAADVRIIADELCEVKLSDDAVEYVHSMSNKFRRIIVELYKAEAVARANRLEVITAANLGRGGK